MIMLPKPLLLLTAAGLAAAVAYETCQVARLGKQNRMLQQQFPSLAGQLRQLGDNFADVSNRLAALQAENSRLKSDPRQQELLKLRGEVALLKSQINQDNDPTQLTATSWFNRVNRLKAWLLNNPAAGIPELALLRDEDWLATVKDLPLDSDRQYRVAMSNLRNTAEEKFGNEINAALEKYLQANHNKFPNALGRLRDYFGQPVDSAMLERWQIVRGKAVNSDAGKRVITQKAAVDDLLDERQIIAEDQRTRSQFLDKSLLDPVYEAYFKANPNADGHGLALSSLLPYATTSAQRSLIQKWDEYESYRKEGYR